jgi:hypothetical protein
MESLNITEDYLVTYREFMSALRSLKGQGQGMKGQEHLSLYKKLLPRTLSFADVLES